MGGFRITNGRARVRNGKSAAASAFSTIGDVVVDGDSITDVGWNNAAFRLGFPLTKYPPRIVFNAAVAGQTTQALADKLQGDINKFPNVKVWEIRVGTNGWNIPLADHQFQFNRIFSILEANGVVGVLHSIPPRSAGTPGVNSGLIALNAWIKAQCEAKPDRRYYVEDSQDLGDANYNALAPYYFEPEPEGRIHPNGKGVVAQAQRMASRLLAIFPHVDPRILDGNDTYAKNAASNQYINNPLMASPVAANFNGGAITGTIPSGYEMSNGNNTGTGCTPAVIAADAGDAVQAPWLRLGDIHAGGANHYMFLQTALTHPAIAADNTIKRFDIVAEVRFNALDTSVLNGITMSLFNGDGVSGFAHTINLTGNPGVLTMPMVLRSSNVRTQEEHGQTSRALRAYPANSLTLRFYFEFSGALASVGSVDIRCVSVRAQTD